MRHLPRRDQHVRLGEVGGAAQARDIVGYDDELPRHPGLAAEVAGEIHHLRVLQAQRGDVFAVHQHHPPLAGEPAIAILQAIDGGVVLVVASHRHHQELAGLEVPLRQRVHGKARFPSGIGKPALAGAIGKVEAAVDADALVVALEPGDDLLDQLAGLVVVHCKLTPADLAAVAQRRLREARDELRLGDQVLAGGLRAPPRHLHHAHRVLGGDELVVSVLHVSLGASEAGQDERCGAGDEVPAIQLGRNVRGELGAAKRGGGIFGVRGRGEEVAPQPDEDLRAAFLHCMD